LAKINEWLKKRHRPTLEELGNQFLTQPRLDDLWDRLDALTGQLIKVDMQIQEILLRIEEPARPAPPIPQAPLTPQTPDKALR